MQQLDVQPNNPTPYTPVTGMYNNNPVPGAGGLPSLSDLNNRVNPMAQELQSMGRGEDKMLVHMTPEEVNSLQGLAMHYGTTMTINPNTGLPEAGLLGSIFKKLIPTLLGGALAATGIGAPLAAGIVGLGSTALTGSLKKGLLAGLGAFGGASLAGAAGLGSKVAGGNAFGLLSDKPGIFGAGMGTGASSTGLAAWNASNPSFFGRFAQTAKQGLPSVLGKAAPAMAASGLLGTVGQVDQAIQENRSQGPITETRSNWAQEGPYMPTERVLAPRLTGPGGRGEIDYFQEPQFGGYLTASGELRGLPGYVVNQPPRGFAEGGSTDKTDNSQLPWLTKEMTDPKIVEATRNEYLKAFDERLKGINDLTDVNQRYAQSLRNELATNYAVDDKGNKHMVTVPQLDSIKRGVFERLEGALKEARAGASTGTNTASTRLTLDNVGGGGGGGTGSNTSSNTTVNTASAVLGYDPNTPTSKVPGLPPGATVDSYGVYTLKDRYTPQFTKVEDFVTEKVNPYTGGTEQTNKLEEYIKSYRTSPGKLGVTSMGYAPGQSPSERNRAYALELARQEEARRAAAAAGTGAGTGTGTGTGVNTAATSGFYYNPTTNLLYSTPNFTGPAYVFDPVTGAYRPKDEEQSRGGGGNSLENNVQMVAKGGSIHMDDGAFVVDARTVSELGNGSSNAGIELLRRLGGHPVRGPGDGVSDSVRANIGGKQPARVARDEVIFPAAAVKKLGGAKKLYALMDKAHKARKKAGRGTDTKLRMGLGAL